MIDNADGGFYCLVPDDEIIDCALFAVIIGGILQACQYEYIEIGNIFIRDMAVGLCMFDPLAASVRAEKDNHVCGGEPAADDFNDTL